MRRGTEKSKTLGLRSWTIRGQSPSGIEIITKILSTFPEDFIKIRRELSSPPVTEGNLLGGGNDGTKSTVVAALHFGVWSPKGPDGLIGKRLGE